jgi:hypothetical protein
MKKAAVIVLLFIAGAVFGQDAFLIGISVKMMAGFIGNPVPSVFTRIDRETYTNSYVGIGSIILNTNGNDNIVIDGSIGAIFNTTHDASSYLSVFYDYFETTEWQYKKIDNIDTYTNNNTITIILSPYKRIDGYIVAQVVFRKIS